jgi:ATP-dependent RNA helicase DHX8/PRP22
VTECEQRVKDFLNELSPPSIHGINNTSNAKSTIDTKRTCPICMDNLESPYSLQQCGHKYCRSCLSYYFNTCLDVTKSITSFKLSCLIEQCDKLCLISDIESVLGHELMPRLATIAFQIYIRQPENDLAQCSGVNCKQVQC